MEKTINNFEQSISLKPHDSKYIEQVKNSFPSKGFSSLDGDTIISPGSKNATFDAAGSIICCYRRCPK